MPMALPSLHQLSTRSMASVSSVRIECTNCGPGPDGDSEFSPEPLTGVEHSSQHRRRHNRPGYRAASDECQRRASVRFGWAKRLTRYEHATPDTEEYWNRSAQRGTVP